MIPKKRRLFSLFRETLQIAERFVSLSFSLDETIERSFAFFYTTNGVGKVQETSAEQFSLGSL
jgi:hypothetical protein